MEDIGKVSKHIEGICQKIDIKRIKIEIQKELREI